MTKSGIHLPDGAELWPTIGTVLAVGSRVEEKALHEGVRVFFKSRPASALIPDDRLPGQRDHKEWERVVVLREEDIYGIIVEE